MDPEERLKSIKASDFFNVFKSKLCIMLIIVFSVSALLVYLSGLSTHLMASSRNIPGVVTSVFVNKDFGHLSGNLFVAFIGLAFYSGSSTISGERNDNFLIIAIWVSAILANLVFVLMSPAYLKIYHGPSGLAYVWIVPTSYGSSGLVSALLAGVMALAYKNAWTEPIPRFKLGQFLIGIALFVLFIILNLNVAPRTNVAVHVTSFLFMVLCYLVNETFYAIWHKLARY